jgi:predicted nucleic acid-binding Zn ribbon protein
VVRWAQIVGPAGAEHAEVESFDEGKLLVRADSEAWAANLRLLAPQLMRNIIDTVGEGVVEEVIVRGPVSRRPRGRWRVQGSR